MRSLLSVVLIGAVIAIGIVPSLEARTNLGSDEPAVFEGHDLTPDMGGPRVLYAPSEADDPAYRSEVAATIGGTCDYFDARAATPDGALMDTYDCVHTWANYPYHDNVLFGDRLADRVDRGGHVVLGAFAAYTTGNHLAGRIMTDTSRYCPVTGGFIHVSLTFWDGSGSGECCHAGVTSYGVTYHDLLALRAGFIMGRYIDGDTAVASNIQSDVLYVNGAGGRPLGATGDIPRVVGNGCICGPIDATESHSWGAVKNLYR